MPRISKSSSMISDQLRVGSYGCPTFPQIITMCLSLVKVLLGFSHNKGVSPYSLGFGFLETGNPHISALVLLTSYKTVLLLFVLLCNKNIFFFKPLTIYCFSVKKQAIKFRNQECRQTLLQIGSRMCAPQLHLFYILI